MTDENPRPESALAKLDAWMAQSMWHPRLVPFFVYILGLMATGYLITPFPVIRPAVYAGVVAVICFLLWRYRKLLPELNIRFHWLAIPTGVGLLFAWVYLGYWTNQAAAAAQGTPVLGPLAEFFVGGSNPQSVADEANRTMHAFQRGQEHYGDVWFWITMVLRLLGMTLVVPLFEELFVRSAVIRATISRRLTWRGILQVLHDLPLIGDYVSNTKQGQAADAAPPAFTEQLTTTPVGRISAFSVAASTLVFMLSHMPRDWAGCIACGVVWGVMVWWTNRPRPGKGETWENLPEGGRTGLGPVVWSHGITNALLWAWTLHYGDWQFL
ncbi:MAG: type II CAAX prenyl endopeptidase Rce1 family protein [Phycisphaerales bacterium JB063]